MSALGANAARYTGHQRNGADVRFAPIELQNPAVFLQLGRI